MTADRLDVCRDAGALLRATAGRDHEAVRILLDHSDNRAVCEVLAVIAVTAMRPYGPGFLDDLGRELRGLNHQED